MKETLFYDDIANGASRFTHCRIADSHLAACIVKAQSTPSRMVKLINMKSKYDAIIRL